MSRIDAIDTDHAERMDRMYRYQRHIYDLSRKYYLLGRDKAIADLHLAPGETILEVGCGTGRNLLLAHKRYPQAALYGLDISAQMLQSTRRNFASASAKPHLCVADATKFQAQDFSTTGFDRILISYALSMIPGWTGAIDASLAALSPGGSLHIVDFGQQEGLPAWFRTLLQNWLARFHVTPRADLEEVLRQKAAATGCDITFERLYRGYAWHAVLRKPEG
ncbi:class I SAM-dependent methyltransferase [Rhizobium helianthi]|uniref:Class I SAM-dependent methyltransferase n=1 Tax=Rhizobium helianthi TaxID=1132695 RepID=A0ABW4M6M0_9HYPH